MNGNPGRVRRIEPTYRVPCVLTTKPRRSVIARGRHAGLGPSPDRIDVEMDDRYRRTDMSEVHAWEARRAFALNLSRGEAGVSLAEAALHVVSEDDAIASHSVVAFPVATWLQRIQRMTDDITYALNQEARKAGTSTVDLSPTLVIQVVEEYLFVEQRIRVPDQGRSPMPPDRVVLPTAFEDVRMGYMSELLVRRVGHPGLVAILYADVMHRLLQQGVIDFAVAMDTRDFSARPRPVVLPGLTRNMLLLDPGGSFDETGSSSSSNSSSSSSSSSGGDAGPGRDTSRVSPSPGGEVLNTCTSEALLEVLRLLKRAYWPFEWDTGVDAYARGGQNSQGGFRAAAKVATGEEMSALLSAAGRSAKWRLANGVWTAPRVGDIRRAFAACERLVMAAADQFPEERRDLAVLLLHVGNLAGAAAELKEYMASPGFAVSDPFDRALCRKMAATLGYPSGAGGDDAGEPYRVVSIASVLERPRPEQRDDDRKPLTW